jgi:phosphohistidine phosphatase
MRRERELYVLRHAKSSWDDPGLRDSERPLSPRGRRAAKVIAEYLTANEIRPEVVLCSPARRTLQTLEGVSPTGRVMIEDPLYQASADQLLERLRRLPAETRSVMVIGHNPSLQMLILKLAGTRGIAPSGHLIEIERKFPTAALASLGLHCAWAELRPGCAELTDYVRPKALLYG